MRLLFALTCLVLTITSAPLLAADNLQIATPQLTKETAAKVLKGIRGQVINVKPAPVPGLYQVDMKMDGKTIPIYLDGKGEYLFTGNVIRIKDRKNLTEIAYQQLNPVKTDQIPLDDALIMGRADAPQRVLVFTDPHCPFCTKLHKVLPEVIKDHPEIAFYIKLIPFHQSSQKISKTIVCNKSMEQLEMAFAGKAVPEPECETDAIAKNLMLAQKLGIHGTPTLILPNGQMSSGFHPKDELIKLILANQAPAEK